MRCKFRWNSRKALVLVVALICSCALLNIALSNVRDDSDFLLLGSEGPIPLRVIPSTATCRRAFTEWNRTYAKIHHEMIADKNGSSPRLAIIVATESGLADRLTGLLTLFYYSLLTGRAIQTVTYGALPDLSTAFDSPFINWSASYPEEMFDNMKFTYKGIRGLAFEARDFNYSHYPDNGYWYFINDMQDANSLVERNLTAFDAHYFPRAKRLFISSNRGRTYRLFHNPYYNSYFLNLGLFPTALARCAFRFLFAPNNDTLALMEPINHLLSDPTILRIGIAIRSGDFFLSKKRQPRISQFRAHFKCAEEIERGVNMFANRSKTGEELYEHSNSNFNSSGAINSGITRVVWFLISDSVAIRKQAKEEYGDKLVTIMDQEPVHIDCAFVREQPSHPPNKRGQTNQPSNNENNNNHHHHNNSSSSGEQSASDHNQNQNQTTSPSPTPPSACSRERMNDALRFAVAEMLLFSKTQYQVMSAASGFAAMSAWLSDEVEGRHTWTLTPKRHPPCTLLNADHPGELSARWSGM